MALIDVCPCIIIQNVQEVHTRVPSAIQNVFNVHQTQFQTQREQLVLVMKDSTALKQLWKLVVKVMKKALIIMPTLLHVYLNFNKQNSSF